MILVVGLAGVGQAAEKTIPVGTVITQQNWRKYSQFIPIDLKWMLESKAKVDGWPKGAKAIVGPTIHYAAPSSYWNATEKYSKNVKLVKVPNGSYTIEGYVAGQPFPNLNPNDPLAGYKLMYDFYFANTRAIEVGNRIQVADIDRYGNESDIRALVWTYEWMHITDPGYPMSLPGAGGVYLSGGAEQLSPEQIKYVTSLDLTYNDPNRFPDTYVYLPALRRSLRLSSAARCAPFQGQDFANDDFTPVPLPPTWFKAEFMGEKPMLEFVFKPGSKTMAESAKRRNWYFSGGNFIPKASLFGNSWQLRKVDILEMQRLPQHAAGYCYANRVQYLDKEQAMTLGWANWDQSNRPWRTLYPFSMPMKMPRGDGWHLFTATWAHDGCDYQNDHCSQLLPPDGAYIDQNTPARFQNRQLYGTPAGLDQIMR